MRLWRVSNKKHAPGLDGEGARRYGGRWNNRGIALVYSAPTISLATLEIFVHLDPRLPPTNYVLIAIDVPDKASIETLDLAKLPKNWARYPAPPKLATIGDDWAKSRRSLLLKVPSAIVPEEHNILLNPLHDEIVQCSGQIIRSFEFDARMIK